MSVRLNVVGLFAAAALISACGPDRITEEDAGQDAGCTGACNADGGPDGGGENLCADVSMDGGVVTLEELRNLQPCGQVVTVLSAVVHTVDFASDSGFAPFADISAEFYVGKNADAGEGPGVFVDKYFSDLQTTYKPEVGHRVQVKGFLYEKFNRNSGRPNTENRVGYRLEIGAQHNVDGGPGKLSVTFLSANNSAAEAIVDSSYSAQNGTVAARPDRLGSRVYLPGPVYVANAEPSFMLRYNYDQRRDAGEQVFLDLTRDNYEGFVLDNGVVVADYKIRSSDDSCGDYRERALPLGDGGFYFPNGIRGVWETFAMQPFTNCAGGAQFYTCAPASYIPDVDGGFLTSHINVIVPQDCEFDADGGQPVQ